MDKVQSAGLLKTTAVAEKRLEYCTKKRTAQREPSSCTSCRGQLHGKSRQREAPTAIFVQGLPTAVTGGFRECVDVAASMLNSIPVTMICGVETNKCLNKLSSLVMFAFDIIRWPTVASGPASNPYILLFSKFTVPNAGSHFQGWELRQPDVGARSPTE